MSWGLASQGRDSACLADIIHQLLERGPPIPSYTQNASESQRTPNIPLKKPEDVNMDDARTSTSTTPQTNLFTVYTSAGDILYTPEASLEQGIGMVKTIRNSIKQLQLGSKLRQEVWLRELARFIHFSGLV